MHAIPGDIRQLVEDFLLHKQARGAARNTLLAYRADLSLMAEFMSRHGITLVQLVSERLLDQWVDDGVVHLKWARRSAARRVSSVRAFLSWAQGRRYVEHNAAERVRVRFRACPVIAPEMVSLRHVVGRIGTRDPFDLRDRAVLLLMLDCALRASEVATLDLREHVGAVYFVDVVGRRVYVRPKGLADDERGFDVVGMEDQTADAVRAWLKVRKVVAPAGEPALFVNRKGQRASRHLLYCMVNQRRAQAGIVGLNPHKLRHRRVAAVVETLGVKMGQAQARHRHASTTVNVYGAHAGEVVRNAIRQAVPVGEVLA